VHNLLLSHPCCIKYAPTSDVGICGERDCGGLTVTERMPAQIHSGPEIVTNDDLLCSSPDHSYEAFCIAIAETDRSMTAALEGS
jgi:hypothetical protein